MKVRAIDFVQIGVADMGRALRFYRETLGMDFLFSQGGMRTGTGTSSTPRRWPWRWIATARRRVG